MNLLVFILMAFAAQPVWSVDSQQGASLFQQGIDSYQKGQFEDARRAFEQALDAPQYRLAALYNLGNVAFRERKIGEALAFYRRALGLKPRDLEVRNNAAIAFDSLKIKSLPGPISTWENFRRSVLQGFSVDEAFATLCLTALLVALSIGKYFRARFRSRTHEEEAPKLHPVSIISIFLFVVVGTLLALKVLDAYSKHATVIISKVEMKSGPAEDNATLFEVPEGLELVVLQEHGGWFQVIYPGGLAGWVPERAVMLTSGNGPW